jgi:UDP-N-acetyl-D-glucosamine dehydrogenase
MSEVAAAPTLGDRLADRSAIVGVIGLGYVGLPLAVACARAGFRTIGFDVDPKKPVQLNAGQSYIDAVTSEDLASLVSLQRLCATDDLARLDECDVVTICVPTPLTRRREPDLSFVEATSRAVALTLRRGQLVVLESTTYPGTTREVVKPLLEQSGLRSGEDFLLAYSPEREDPGNGAFDTRSIPKVVAGDGPAAAAAAEAFYGAVVERVVPVSSLDAAEAVKIAENVFRAVNIALVNELKLVFDRMGVDVWEVIEAAKTKPFGYMPFYPGPGLGGHCIPIDPFYLAWKSREFGLPTRFIELAGEINLAMPRHVVAKLEEGMERRLGKSLGGARVLIVGLAYKRNVADVRESPTFKLMELLEDRGAVTSFHDPHVGLIPPTREYASFAGRRSVALSSEALAAHDAVLIATDHDAVDYALIGREARLIVDTRNAMARRGIAASGVVKA